MSPIPWGCLEVWGEVPAREAGIPPSRAPASPGLILRRCELDEEGIAYWEPPTYIRCVSIDYRNIQMMVRAALGSPAPSRRGPPLPSVLTRNPASPVARPVGTSWLWPLAGGGRGPSRCGRSLVPA